MLLAVAALAFLLPGLASLPPVDRDEARFTQASKQMLESGDYIDIRFQDQHRYKKPVGIYWLQTASVTLTGGDSTSAIWRYRLVSVAAGAASVLLIAMLGARLFCANAGFAAGLMLAGLLGLGFEGRIAKTDATLLAVTLLAQTALAHVYLSAKDNMSLPKIWPVLLWVAIGVGVLIKGPLTLAIIGLTIAGVALFDKDRIWLRGLKPLWGLVIVAAIAAPWLIAITLKSDGAFWAESVGRDMLGKVAQGQESHGGPPGYYMLTYSLYMWPFGYLALIGGLKALHVWREPRILFCLSWYVPIWLIFELVPTKLPHYPLPAYPAIVLLAGWGLFGAGQTVTLLNWQKWLSWLGAFGVVVVSAAFAAIAISGPLWFGQPFSLIGLVAAVFALIAGWLALGFGRPQLGIARLFATSLCAGMFYALAFSFVLPGINALWVSRTVADTLKSVEGCADPVLASVDFQEPSLVFLAGTGTKLTDMQGLADHLIAGDECALALLPTEKRQELQTLTGSLETLETIRSISGFNYSKGSAVSLELVRLSRQP
jgi:4-amino-4-deoxy-L-arabinose transferase-like glycosyltransferase